MLTFIFNSAILYLENILNRKAVVTIGFPDTFKALSDPVRREILIMLKNGKLTAGDISAEFDMTGATISYHLAQLKKAGLVIETKFKNYIYYEIQVSVLEEISLWVSQFWEKQDEKE